MTDVATYIYLDDWTDETMPCAPTLQGWAEWLSKPDTDWNRDEAARDGEEFATSSLRVLIDLKVVRTADGFQFDDPPRETTVAFLRYGGPETGWDAEQSTYPGATSPGETPDLRTDIIDLLEGTLDVGDEAFVACCADGPNQRVRYTANPPALLIIGSVN